MKIKIFFKTITNSKMYQNIKTLFTLGGNSKFAPSSLTFFVMISLVPVISLVISMLSIFGYNIDDLLKYLQENLNLESEVMEQLKIYFLDIPNSNKILFGVGLFFLIYIASKGITFFMYAYAKINKTNTRFNGFFLHRLWGIILSIILEVFLAILISFLIIFNNFFIIENLKIRSIFYTLFILLIFFVFLLFLYSISSNKKEKFHDVFLGALISSISISIGMSFYIYYINNFSNATNYYGSLTAFILLLLVIYYSSYIVLLGVQINHMKKKKAEESVHFK